MDPKRDDPDHGLTRQQQALHLLDMIEMAVEHGMWEGDVGYLADFMHFVGIPVPKQCGQHCPICRPCRSPCRFCDTYEREYV